MDWIAPSLTAFGTIILGFFTYNQYTRNKLTDFKIEQLKKDETVKRKVTNDSYAKIYGVLYHLLYALKATRVYIVQPHPLNKSQFVSVRLEIKSNGIAPISTSFQNLPMQDIAHFTSELASRSFICHKDIEKEMRDKRARALLTINGAHSCFIKRLTTSDTDWIGNIVVEFTGDLNPDILFARTEMFEAANNIQFVLPPLDDHDK